MEVKVLDGWIFDVYLAGREMVVWVIDRDGTRIACVIDSSPPSTSAQRLENSMRWSSSSIISIGTFRCHAPNGPNSSWVTPLRS